MATGCGPHACGGGTAPASHVDPGGALTGMVQGRLDSGACAGPMEEAAKAPAPVAVTTIDQFYASRHCIVCDSYTPARQPICTWCQGAPQMTAAVLQVRRQRVVGVNGSGTGVGWLGAGREVMRYCGAGSAGEAAAAAGGAGADLHALRRWRRRRGR